MSKQIVVEDSFGVAKNAAELTIKILSESIQKKDEAVWVLAGGSSPMATYKLLAEEYRNYIDWGKVVFIIGDERCVSIDDSDSNLGQIIQVFFNKIDFSSDKLHMPDMSLSPDLAAEKYSVVIDGLLKDDTGRPILDLVWLGIGEDGHTLSLFPEDEKKLDYKNFVEPIYDSPKPPSERITLTLRALAGAKNVLYLISGEAKASIYKKIQSGSESLPSVLAANTVEENGGNVTWLVDKQVDA